MLVNPCNCFGKLSVYEGEQFFHEMGIDGCVRTPLKEPIRITVAKAMRQDYIDYCVSTGNTNLTKTWDEIDEQMREIWLLHADSALKVIGRK